MNILNVQLKYIIGGNPQVCLDYSRMLLQTGNKVTTMVSAEDPFINELKTLGSKVIIAKRIGELGPYDILTINYFRKIINEVKPDLIIAHEGRLVSLLRFALFGKKIPLLDVNHCRSPKRSKYADATIVLNSARLLEYQNAYRGKPVYFLPNSIASNIDATEEFLQKPKRLSASELYSDGKNKAASVPVIGVMARLVYHKGIDIFIDALSVLNAKNVKFKALILGDGIEREKLEAKIDQYGLAELVSLPGYDDNIAGFFDKIDIFCMASRHEEFGLVILWAFKYGVPVVTTDTEGPSDICEHGQDALVVPVKNPELLAAALQELTQNPEKAKWLANNAFDKFISKYDTQVVAKNLNDIVHSVKL